MRIRRRSAAMAAPGELNLVPIMNLIVCLVPIVLLGMAAVKVSVIETNAPRFGVCGAGCQGGAKPLDLRVHIGAAGITVSTGTADLDVSHFDRSDLVGVYQRAVALKQTHPEETIANLTADPAVPFRDVVALMDVLRHRLDGAVHDRGDLARLFPADAAGRPAELFPDVIFAVAP